MDTVELLKIRIVSFLYQVGTSLVVLAVGYFASPDFAALVSENFGTVAAGLVSLLVPEIVKHFRNVAVLNAAAAQFGSIRSARENVTLI